MKKLPKLKAVEHEFGLIGAIMAIAGAAYGTILPLVILAISQSDRTVGYYYSALSILSFLVAIFSTYLFSHFNKIKIFRINVFISLVVLFLMTFLDDSFSFYIVDLVRAFCVSMAWMSMTLMIKEIVRKKDVKVAMTKYNQWTGVGAMAGAFMGGYTAKYFGNSVIFIIAGVFLTIAFFLFAKIPIEKDLEKVEKVLLKKAEKKKESPFSIFRYLTEYFRDRNKFYLHTISILNGVWDSVFGVYFPIMIIGLQYNQDVIGNIKVLITLIGISLGSYMMKLPDHFKYNHLFSIGWIVTAMLSFGYAIFNDFDTVYILFALFAFRRIPTFLIGDFRRMYFFSGTNSEEAAKYFGIYETGWRLGSILGPLIASAMLSVSMFIFNDNSLNLMWVGMGIISLITALISFRIGEPSIQKKKS